MCWPIFDRPSSIDQDPTHPHPDAPTFLKQALSQKNRGKSSSGPLTSLG
jgi:hypothetical protein